MKKLKKVLKKILQIFYKTVKGIILLLDIILKNFLKLYNKNIITRLAFTVIIILTVTNRQLIKEFTISKYNQVTNTVIRQEVQANDTTPPTSEEYEDTESIDKTTTPHIQADIIATTTVSYMEYYAITSTTSRQYKLRERAKRERTD